MAVSKSEISTAVDVFFALNGESLLLELYLGSIRPAPVSKMEGTAKDIYTAELCSTSDDEGGDVFFCDDEVEESVDEVLYLF